MTDEVVRVSVVVGRRVVDVRGVDHGVVLDIRVVQDGPVTTGGDASLRVDGLLVGTGRAAERSGLLRRKVHGPWLLRQLARLLGPTPRFVPWRALVAPTDLQRRGEPILIVDEPIDPPD